MATSNIGGRGAVLCGHMHRIRSNFRRQEGEECELARRCAKVTQDEWRVASGTHATRLNQAPIADGQPMYG